MKYQITAELVYTEVVEAEDFDTACEKVMENALIWGEWTCDLEDEQED